jgi:hypothetical protein
MWTSGVELSWSGGGSSFAGEVVLSGACEDAGAGEVVWLAEGMSGVAVAAGFVGTPDYPSGIPDMHTIHDPMISVS